MSTILIIGSYNAFTNNLINKLYLEKWRIYILCSNKKYIKPAHVFEQYVFDYNSDSVKEIIKSCRPDVILFTGAYDSKYNWKSSNVKDTALSFTEDLSNILISAAMLGVGRFIYISSEIVFEDEYIVDIKEDMPVTPNSYKGMIISQGENMALHYGQSKQMDVTVVRIANMYGVPINRTDCNDIYSKMYMEALVNGRLKVNAKKVFSSLFVKDAVDSLYLLIKSQERNHQLYHISSMKELTEDKVAQLIKENCSHPVDIVDQTKGLRQRIILSNERFYSEFSFQIQHSHEDIIPKIVAYINRHKKRFLNYEELDNIGYKNQLFHLFRKAIPFVEGIVLFIPVFMLSHGIIVNRYFEGINFYLLYVLLFAIMYGRQQAIFASLLSVIGYSLSRVLNSTDRSLFDADIYIQLVQIFVVGLSVGHLKDKLNEIKGEMNDEIEFLKVQLKDISVINSSNARIKDYYTDKLISSTESIGRIYDITSKLQKSEVGEVLFSALDTLTEIMETEDVSIYLVSNMSFCRLASATTAQACSLGKTITMSDYDMIFDELKMGKVYINRTLDSSLPMMASALFDDERNMRIVIILWNLPFERMTLYHSNLLSIVGAMVYSVFVRDANYLDALAYRRYIPETTILQEAAFEEMVNIYRRAKIKGYSELSILYIHQDGISIKEINEKIRPILRETDYIGMTPDGTLAILLTNTSQKESMRVMERLEKVNIMSHY